MICESQIALRRLHGVRHPLTLGHDQIAHSLSGNSCKCTMFPTYREERAQSKQRLFHRERAFAEDGAYIQDMTRVMRIGLVTRQKFKSGELL